ncbi:MAG: DUF423 domain-containing protein [Actinomycetota bacterium]|nr:DUF423 domain-containing protein [Actinomycetota bacterium]
MDRFFLTIAAAFGFIGVTAGAFGAHALRTKVPAERQAAFETGARYFLYGAFALLAVEWFRAAGPDQVAESWAGVCLTVGTTLFSGSLFALALTGRRRWGAVTPVGGVLLLAGWALLVIAALTAPIRFDLFP